MKHAGSTASVPKLWRGNHLYTYYRIWIASLSIKNQHQLLSNSAHVQEYCSEQLFSESKFVRQDSLLELTTHIYVMRSRAPLPDWRRLCCVLFLVSVALDNKWVSYHLAVHLYTPISVDSPDRFSSWENGVRGWDYIWCAIDLYPLLRNYDVWGEIVGSDWNTWYANGTAISTFRVFTCACWLSSTVYSFAKLVQLFPYPIELFWEPIDVIQQTYSRKLCLCCR